MKTALQQGRSNPSSSMIFPGFSPSSARCLNCSHKWPIGFPQLKHLTGIIILVILEISLKNFCIAEDFRRSSKACKKLVIGKFKYGLGDILTWRT